MSNSIKLYLSGIIIINLLGSIISIAYAKHFI